MYPAASFIEFSEVTVNIQYINKMNNHKNLTMPCIMGQECLFSEDNCNIF